MPARQTTVFECDRCGTVEQNQGSQAEWQGVIVPSVAPAAGQQFLCPECVESARVWLAGFSVAGIKTAA